MSVGSIMPTPVFIGLDDDGNPLSGGKLATYEAGTTTPLATYTDVDLSVAHTNPVVLDSSGRAIIFLDNKSYKFELYDAEDNLVWTADNISSTGLFQGLIQTEVPFNHSIGTAPQFPPFTLAIILNVGGSVQLPPDAIIGAGILVAPVMDLSLISTAAQIDLLSVGGGLSHLNLGSSGTFVVHASNITFPTVTSGGAVVGGASALTIIGPPSSIVESSGEYYSLRVLSGAGPSSFRTGVMFGLSDAFNYSLTSNQNNWDPGGSGSAGARFLINISPSGGTRTLTGLVLNNFSRGSTLRNAPGQHHIIRNSGSSNLVLAHQSGSSDVGNRFFCPGNTNFTLTPGDSVPIHCMGSLNSDGWIVVGVA